MLEESKASDMETSAEVDKLLAALVQFHKNGIVIPKQKFNSIIQNKYADLAAIMTHVTVPLADVGLVLTQHLTGSGEVRKLVTTLFHESGQYMRSSLELMVQENLVRKDRKGNEEVKVYAVTPQSVGSALTYFRRYSISSILSLAIDDDDDGNKASNRRARVQGDEQPDEPPAQQPRPKPSQPSQPPQMPQPVAPAEPFGQEKILEIINKIAQATAADVPGMERALAQHATAGRISKAIWGDCVTMLMERWVSIAAPVMIAGILNKVVEYKAKALITDSAYDRISKAAHDRLPSGDDAKPDAQPEQVQGDLSNLY